MKHVARILWALGLAPAAHADIAYDNFGPGSKFTALGWIVRGPQVSPSWSHAFPVTPTLSGEITTITVALRHLEGATNSYTFQLRANAAGQPGAPIATLGSVPGIGVTATPATFTANPGITITAGTTYWVYAVGENDAAGSWLSSPTPGGSRAYSFNGGNSFTVEPLSGAGAQGAIRIEVAGQACYANCDGSSSQPILTGNDFTCFLNRFVAGEPYANCDGSSTQPTLTANDFVCFLNAFVTGCA